MIKLQSIHCKLGMTFAGNTRNSFLLFYMTSYNDILPYGGRIFKQYYNIFFTFLIWWEVLLLGEIKYCKTNPMKMHNPDKGHTRLEVIIRSFEHEILVNVTSLSHLSYLLHEQYPLRFFDIGFIILLHVARLYCFILLLNLNLQHYYIL